MRYTANKKNILKLNDGFIFAIVIFFALLLRLVSLDNRPLHTDEAVHAVKFGELLENGNYIYDPIEYHGPTLNYFTLIPAWLSGEETFSEISEYTIRLVPAIISVLMIALFIAVPRERNRFVPLATFLLAISPVFVFYSRYYIQESLLVTFTYSAIVTFYKYFRSNQKRWIILSSIFLLVNLD